MDPLVCLKVIYLKLHQNIIISLHNHYKSNYYFVFCFQGIFTTKFLLFLFKSF